jgi:ribosomal protein S27E
MEDAHAGTMEGRDLEAAKKEVLNLREILLKVDMMVQGFFKIHRPMTKDRGHNPSELELEHVDSAAENGGRLMRVECFSCGYEINLYHKVFEDYRGTVKCYSCGAMMVIRTEQGAVCSLVPLESCGVPVPAEKRNTAALVQTVSF